MPLLMKTQSCQAAGLASPRVRSGWRPVPGNSGEGRAVGPKPAGSSLEKEDQRDSGCSSLYSHQGGVGGSCCRQGGNLWLVALTSCWLQ